MDPMPTSSLPVLALASLHEDPSSPQMPAALQMPLREAQSLIYYDPDVQIQGGRQIFVYPPFTTTDLLN
jgi:hypothetical protein